MGLVGSAPRPHAGNRALRVALVCPPGWTLLDWQANIVTRLRADPRIALVGRLEAGAGEARDPRPGWPVRMALAGERWLTRARLPELPLAPAQAVVDSLPQVPADRADVALALTGASLREEDLAALPFGEARLCVGGAAPGTLWLGVLPRTRAAGLVDTDVTLRTAGAPGPRVIARTGYNLKPASVATACFIAEKASSFLIKTLAELGEQDPGEARLVPAPPPPVPGLADLPGYLRDFSAAATERVRERLLERAGRGNEWWALAAGDGGVLGFDPSRARPLARPVAIMADPFLFEHEGALHVFYEAKHADGRPAWIDVARLEGDRLTPLGTALRKDYHLSFPFVFRDGADIFMLPETHATNRVEIWRATRFPFDWELHATALEGQSPADSTLFRHDGTWFLFTNLCQHVQFQEHSSELYLFTCDGPSLGNLRPHPQNPVVIGSAVARNGGAVVAEKGRLFRASQNNSFGVYGYGLNLMEIETLTPERYRERPLMTFGPKDGPGKRRLHHVSFAAGRFVLDWSDW